MFFVCSLFLQIKALKRIDKLRLAKYLPKILHFVSEVESIVSFNKTFSLLHFQQRHTISTAIYLFQKRHMHITCFVKSDLIGHNSL